MGRNILPNSKTNTAIAIKTVWVLVEEKTQTSMEQNRELRNNPIQSTVDQFLTRVQKQENLFNKWYWGEVHRGQK